MTQDVQSWAALSAADVLHQSPEELACQLGCPREDLSSQMRARFGYSLAALRMELRLLDAAELLRQPGSSVESVAFQCGFGDINLFDVCFQKRFGANTLEWQEQRNGTRRIPLPEPQIRKLLRSRRITRNTRSKMIGR